jgi:hypothetical protein
MIQYNFARFSAGDTIDGKSEQGMDLHDNAFQIEDCSLIVLEGFRIRQCT